MDRQTGARHPTPSMPQDVTKRRAPQSLSPMISQGDYLKVEGDFSQQQFGIDIHQVSILVTKVALWGSEPCVRSLSRTYLGIPRIERVPRREEMRWEEKQQPFFHKLVSHSLSHQQTFPASLHQPRYSVSCFSPP